MGFRKIAENQIQSQPKQADRSSACRPISAKSNMQTRTKFTKMISYGFFLFILLWFVVVAAVLLATLKFGLSAEVKFKTLFAL